MIPGVSYINLSIAISFTDVGLKKETPVFLCVRIFIYPAALLFVKFEI